MPEVEQSHIRPWSTAMRVHTDDGMVWFKADGDGPAYEVRLLDVAQLTTFQTWCSELAAIGIPSTMLNEPRARMVCAARRQQGHDDLQALVLGEVFKVCDVEGDQGQAVREAARGDPTVVHGARPAAALRVCGDLSPLPSDFGSTTDCLRADPPSISARRRAPWLRRIAHLPNALDDAKGDISIEND